MSLSLYVTEINCNKMSNQEIARAILLDFDDEYYESLDKDKITLDIIDELENGVPVGDIAYEYLCANYENTKTVVDYQVEVYHPTEEITMIVHAAEYTY